MARLIPEIAPSHSAGRPHRKSWEFAMAALFLRDVGRLGGDAEILDVGAGTEEMMFWLARRARRVVSIDIYGRGSFASGEAAASMLSDPSSHAPYDYPRDRLEVLDMDARRLAFPSESFDVVVSLSSIEHFGGPRSIARAATEIGRVLRPGGHAFLATELFVSKGVVDSAPVQFAVRIATLGRLCAAATPRRRVVGEAFTLRTLQRDVLRPSGLRLMQPISTERSPESGDNVQILARRGRVTSTTGVPFPHVTVRAMRSTWTSLGLPLVKPEA